MLGQVLDSRGPRPLALRPRRAWLGRHDDTADVDVNRGSRGRRRLGARDGAGCRGRGLGAAHWASSRRRRRGRALPLDDPLPLLHDALPRVLVVMLVAHLEARHWRCRRCRYSLGGLRRRRRYRGSRGGTSRDSARLQGAAGGALRCGRRGCRFTGRMPRGLPWCCARGRYCEGAPEGRRDAGGCQLGMSWSRTGERRVHQLHQFTRTTGGEGMAWDGLQPRRQATRARREAVGEAHCTTRSR